MTTPAESGLRHRVQPQLRGDQTPPFTQAAASSAAQKRVSFASPLEYVHEYNESEVVTSQPQAQRENIEFSDCAQNNEANQLQSLDGRFVIRTDSLTNCLEDTVSFIGQAVCEGIGQCCLCGCLCGASVITTVAVGVVVLQASELYFLAHNLVADLSPGQFPCIQPQDAVDAVARAFS